MTLILVHADLNELAWQRFAVRYYTSMEMLRICVEMIKNWEKLAIIFPSSLLYVCHKIL
jgi:hypothetical protein